MIENTASILFAIMAELLLLPLYIMIFTAIFNIVWVLIEPTYPSRHTCSKYGLPKSYKINPMQKEEVNTEYCVACADKRNKVNISKI